MRLAEIRAVIEQKREIHPELWQPLTWQGFRRILDREDVEIVVAASPRPAQLVPYQGGWTILLSSNFPKRRHLYSGAHELGHLWLHHDARCDRAERCFNMDVEYSADTREDDAETFASIILGTRAVRAYSASELDPELLSFVAGASTLRELDTVEDGVERYLAKGLRRADVETLLQQRRRELKEEAITLVRQFAHEVKAKQGQ